jgi:hypothetical protein
MKRALLTAACALLLLAQHVGLAHAVWHAFHKNPAQYEKPDGKPASTAATLCSFDAAIGQVLGGAPAAAYLFSAEPPSFDRIQAAVHVAPPARFLAPLSRGPPALS